MKNKSIFRVIFGIGLAFLAIIIGLIFYISTQSNQGVFKTIDGKKFDFKEELMGKVVVVNFWATWCGPCLVEIPNLVKLKEAYENEPFEIVGISTDDYVEDVLQFKEYQPFNYPVLMATPTLYKMFTEPMAIPLSIILNKEGIPTKVINGYKPIEFFKEEIELLLRDTPVNDSN